MNGTAAYALSKKYTQDTAVQFGAVKGSPCTVAGTSTDADGNTIIKLQWKNDAGAVKTTDVRISKGEDGSSIKTIEIDEDNHLIVTLTDDSVIDAGSLGSGGVLSEDLIATTEIGSIKAGKKYEKGTPLEAILRDILIKVEAPLVSITFNPAQTIYDIIEDELAFIQVKATVTKKTYNVKSVRLYVDDVLIENKETGVEAGGIVTFSYTPAAPIKKTSVFKVIVEDIEGNTKSTTSTISFVGKTYYGYVAKDITAPDEEQIKGLQNTALKTVKGFAYEGITFDFNKIVYAYPQSFGALTSIKDLLNNLNYTNSFTRTEIEVDGIPYYCYTQNNASKAAGINITFA